MIIKFLLRIPLLTLFVCCCCFVCRAQVGYNFAQFDVGFGGALNQVFGDAVTIKTTPSANINFTYNKTPFINFVFELEGGSFAGGDSLKNAYGRQFTSTFNSYTLRAQVQAGEFIDYSESQIANDLKNVYLSAGIDYLKDHITNINRNSIVVPGFYTPGSNNSTEIFIPLRAGYEFKIFVKDSYPLVKIDISYEYNFVFSDELDGFVTGKNNDVYAQIGVGIKLAVGGTNSYRKAINYQP